MSDRKDPNQPGHPSRWGSKPLPNNTNTSLNQRQPGSIAHNNQNSRPGSIRPMGHLQRNKIQQKSNLLSASTTMNSSNPKYTSNTNSNINSAVDSVPMPREEAQRRSVVYLAQEDHPSYTPASFDEFGQFLNENGDVVMLLPRAQIERLQAKNEKAAVKRDNQQKPQQQAAVAVSSSIYDDAPQVDDMLKEQEKSIFYDPSLVRSSKRKGGDLMGSAPRSKLGRTVDPEEDLLKNNKKAIARLKESIDNEDDKRQDYQEEHFCGSLDWDDQVWGAPFLKFHSLPAKQQEKIQEAKKNKNELMAQYYSQPPFKHPFEEDAPMVEWWDAPLLKTGQNYIASQLEQQQQISSSIDSIQSSSTGASLLPLNLSYPPTDDQGFLLGSSPILSSQWLQTQSASEVNVTTWPLRLYIAFSALSNQIHIPRTASPVQSLPQFQATVIKTHLTKAEMIKKRRLERKEERELEKREIQAGLRQPPETRYRLATLNRALVHNMQFGVGGTTEFEQRAKTQIMNRIQAHTERNLERMLTPEEVREKRKRKLKEEQLALENQQAQVQVGVYRLGTMGNANNRKKVLLVAKQQLLTGIIVYCKNIGNVVVVEGGERGLAKFQDLIVRRLEYVDTDQDYRHDLEVQKAEQSIQLGHDQSSASNDERSFDPDFGKSPHVNCQVIWRGGVIKRSFQKLSAQSCSCRSEVKKLFYAFSVSQYYDLIKPELM